METAFLEIKISGVAYIGCFGLGSAIREENIKVKTAFNVPVPKGNLDNDAL